eukprot:CAMPEP_0119418202 /NCGR_PEP_ID=MMETSP1335-20130426/17641_1 /TAXON_ID=259385 /ORGANISM="Chrysoculter rhomboideus, Strain RCC1486" /LENGTH=115 /DNA_ID=CAMNT_0007443431 /DNA_START=604 /DNA_END=951 /DNA_ORIENTATION=-
MAKRNMPRTCSHLSAHVFTRPRCLLTPSTANGGQSSHCMPSTAFMDCLMLDEAALQLVTNTKPCSTETRASVHRSIGSAVAPRLRSSSRGENVWFVECEHAENNESASVVTGAMS